MAEGATTRYLPRAVQTFLGSDEVTNINLDIKKKFELREKELDVLYDLTWDILEGRQHPRAMMYELKSQLKWPDKKAGDVAIEVLGRKILPLSNIVPGVAEAIKGLGGDPSKFPAKKVAPEQTTVPDFTGDMIKAMGIQLPDKFLVHRLENIVDAKVKGVRDDFETKERLIRGAKIGGLDIAPTLADQIIQYIDSAKSVVSIVEPTGAAIKAPGPAGTPAMPRVAAEPEIPGEVLEKETGKTEVFTVRPEDIREIVKEKERDIPSPVLVEFQRIEKEIIGQSGVKFSEPDMQNRFENAVQARVRDVRDELETKNFLTRGPREGGLGLPPEKVNFIIALINKKSQPLRERLSKMEQEKKQQGLEKIRKAQQAEKEQEKEGLDQRFAKLTGRTPPPLPEEKIAEPTVSLPLKEERPIPSFKKQPPLAPAAGEAPKLLAPPTAPAVPERKIPVTPAAPPKAEPVHPAKAVPPPRPISRPPATPPPARPKVQVSPPSPPPAAKPRIEEIRYAKPLVGPAEELRNMKLEDFRRLSKDPKEAIIKIKDKADLLEEEEFSKKLDAIAAWQESPVVKTYVNLIQEAFQTGKNVQTIISQRQAQGRDTLTWDEFQAILKLNQMFKI